MQESNYYWVRICDRCALIIDRRYEEEKCPNYFCKNGKLNLVKISQERIFELLREHAGRL